MQWSDEGVILSVRPHGETGAVLELFTRQHGRHLGLVHGGRSRKLRPILQTGNHVDATWKARLCRQPRSFLASSCGRALPRRSWRMLPRSRR